MPAKKAAKKAPAKKATKKVAAKKAVTEPIKSAPKKAAKKSATGSAKKPAPPTTEAIARQAYLNYLHRVENNLPGDSHGDWVAAEKSLMQG